MGDHGIKLGGRTLLDLDFADDSGEPSDKFRSGMDKLTKEWKYWLKRKIMFLEYKAHSLLRQRCKYVAVK